MPRTDKFQRNVLVAAACIALPFAAAAQSQAPAPRTVLPGPHAVTVESYKSLSSLNVGHGGTYRQPGGGWFGEVAVAWLDYQLKGNADAAKWFVGPDCVLCRESAWSVEKKGMR